MDTTHLFRGGIPLEPDLKRLDERFPASSLKPGVRIPYAEAAAVIGCPVRSNRFRTVTTSWRKRVERACGAVIGCLSGEAFTVLDENGKLNMADDKLKTAGRFARRSLQISTRIDAGKLDEDGKKRLNFNAQNAGAILGTLAIKHPQELPTL